MLDYDEDAGTNSDINVMQVSADIWLEINPGVFGMIDSRELGTYLHRRSPVTARITGFCLLEPPVIEPGVANSKASRILA